MTIAQTIRDARTAARISQEELAEATGISRRTIIRMESEKQGESIRALEKIAAALGKQIVFIDK